MAGLAEIEEYEELASWLHQCLDHGVEPTKDSLRKVADSLSNAAERIEVLVERVAPEDWRADPKDRRHTQTAFNCIRCFKTQWFAGAGEDFDKAEALAKAAGWVFSDGWGWYCSEKCRKAETGEGAE